MGKVRVYEYAKQLNMSSKEILSILSKLQIEVSNHMSVIGDEEIKKIEGYFESVRKKAAERQAAQAAEQARQSAPERSEKSRDKGAKQEKAGTAAPKGQKNPREGGGKETGRSRRPRGQASEGRSADARSSAGRPREDRRPEQGQPARVKADKAPFAPAKPSAAEAAKRHHEPKRKSEKHLEREERMGAKLKPKSKRKSRQASQEKPLPEVLTISGPMTVGELAKALNREASEVIKKLMFLGVMATINQEVDRDAIELIADEYGVKVEEKVVIDESQFELYPDEEDEAQLVERPPVVTIMGHVDHGKTTLLDAIRESKVAAGEAGGITQHIGAYQVQSNGKKITFLDTPGHAAFTMMRARGAQVTDITILVVAADDGVMPQTVEAINHAKAAEVPIIVAINKMDKPEANPERIKQELTEYGLVPEEWGGDTIYVPISALQKQGIDELLEMVLLVAEMQELKANPDRNAKGVVIEAELDRGRGPVATVLVQAGTLRVGDALVVGNTFGRVRAMTNEYGKRLKEAGPSTPVEITGLNDVPHAGDHFRVFEDEKKAKQIAQKRSERQREEELGSQTRVTLDDLYKQIQEGNIKELNLIIKADVQGTVEALRGALEELEVEGARINIIHAAVGAITESDVTLASASNAIIVGFNVRPEPQAKVEAEQQNVQIRLHSVIYQVTEEIEKAMKGLLEPVYEETVIGQAEIRQIFKVSKVGTIAGCYVTQGKVTRDSSVTVIRDGVVIYQGKLSSLKRFKDDVREVAQGYECGLTVENYNDLKEGDQLEFFVMQEVEQH